MLLRFLNPTFVGFLLLIIIFADKEDAASVFSNFLGIATLVYLVNGGTYSIIVFQLHNDSCEISGISGMFPGFGTIARAYVVVVICGKYVSYVSYVSQVGCGLGAG